MAIREYDVRLSWADTLASELVRSQLVVLIAPAEVVAAGRLTVLTAYVPFAAGVLCYKETVNDTYPRQWES